MKFNSFKLGYDYNLDDMITQDGYKNICIDQDDIQFAPIITLDYSHCWRGKEYSQFKIEKPVIVTSHADKSLTDYYINMHYKPILKKWFSTNADCVSEYIMGLPHGLTNDCDDTYMHPILGNKEVFENILSEKVDKINTCYMNFSINTNQPIRQYVWDIFKDKDFVIKQPFNLSLFNQNSMIDLMNKRELFLKGIQQSKFVLCPEGNGIDTVRLWETLYCGSIPIVKKHRAMRYFEGLPILWIDNWSDIKSKFYLEKKYEQIMDSLWNLDMLKQSYWNTLILNAVNN